MTLTIFCPNGHLILSQERCADCGWQRPKGAGVGQPAWKPLVLEVGLGGPGFSSRSQPVIIRGIAVLPLRSGELAGVSLAEGALRWQTNEDNGLIPRGMVIDGERTLIAMCDERSLELSGSGSLSVLDSDSGLTQVIWKAKGHHISQPALNGDLIFLFDTSVGLLALSRKDKPGLIWKQDLHFSNLPPWTAGNVVMVAEGQMMRGEVYLRAFSTNDGQPLWKYGLENRLLTALPTLAGGKVILRDGQSILALDIQSGQKLWQETGFEKIYSAPIADDSTVYFTARGNTSKGDKGHYLLIGLDLKTGKVRWQIPLGERVSGRPLLAASHIFLGGEKGLVMGFDLGNGDEPKPAWDYRLGSEEDPIQTELAIYGDLLLAGTYSGRVAALHLNSPGQEVEEPQFYLERGEFENAAASWAVKKDDMLRAGGIYVTSLNEPRKAIQLYEYGGFQRQAAELAREQGWLDQAETLYRRAGAEQQVVEVLMEKGDKHGAARLILEIGRRGPDNEKMHRAAKLFEEIGEGREALDIYIELNDIAEIRRLRQVVGYNQSEIEELEEKGDFLKAGDAAMQIQQYEHAARNYEKAGPESYPKLLDALLKINKKGDYWVFKKITLISHKLGMFSIEADAWVALGQNNKAAVAFERSARQLIYGGASRDAEIADLFEKAAGCFHEDGLLIQENVCRVEVLHYRHLPRVIVSAHSDRNFREGEYNTLELQVQNIGYGVARNICVKLSGEHFQVDSSCDLEIDRLGIGANLPEAPKIHARPKEGDRGEAVPLHLEWSWRDQWDQPYTGKINSSVRVLGKEDIKSKDTSVNIGVQNVFNAPVAGRDIFGDGARIGDSVEDNRITGMPSRSGRSESPVLCPVCKLPLAEGSVVCAECDNEIPLVIKKKTTRNANQGVKDTRTGSNIDGDEKVENIGQGIMIFCNKCNALNAENAEVCIHCREVL